MEIEGKSLTHTQSGGLLLVCILTAVSMFILKSILPPAYVAAIAVLWVFAIYSTVPSGRGTLDFKVGMIVGAVLAITVYDGIMAFHLTFLKG